MSVQSVVNEIITCLKSIEGIRAIVLGGSRATGTHTDQSDFDIGIYYDSDKPFVESELNHIAVRMDDRHQGNLVTKIGEWGPWVNGGGWLVVKAQPVDFLYRDITKVTKVIEDCTNGLITIDYQPGHPHGFVNHIYMAEVALCQALWDPYAVIASLKRKTTPYPKSLQRGIFDKFLWEAEFSLNNARKGITRTDVSYVAGCCFRTISCILQVLFALNERYFLNEKGAALVATSFPHCPSQFEERIRDVFTAISKSYSKLESAIEILEQVLSETTTLVHLQ